MTLVSLTASGNKLHCTLNKGGITAEGDSRTILGAPTKAYIRLMTNNFKTRTFKWRKIWTER